MVESIADTLVAGQVHGVGICEVLPSMRGADSPQRTSHEGIVSRHNASLINCFEWRRLGVPWTVKTPCIWSVLLGGKGRVAGCRN